ncbi:MAG TPA: type II toxin-antitoxin system RatA family toxin [Hyphomicrobiaceae bacterium]|nr:type II toxin-antitoxin system RatA family toxin [Hyphomicrobiaceae bacterium]
MPTYSTKRHVPHSAREMFDLVADVERYPEFLPLCEALKVKSRGGSVEKPNLIADMTCGYGAIRETFTSRVTLERGAATPQILVEYLDGPFRRLVNQWRFVERPGGSTVDFFIDYEFKSIVLQLLMGAMFDRAFQKFAEAFETRAVKVYGARPATG